MSPTNNLSPPSSGKQPQSKQRSIFNSCINHLTDLTNINHLRQIQATYDPRQAPETLKLQLLIKSQKSLVFDAQYSSRDSYAVSKQFYLWSQEQTDSAIQDVGDRLAYMTYQIGDLQSQFSQNLEKSRSDLKQIRNLENELIKLRDRERALQAHISKSYQDEKVKKAETTERMNVMMKEYESIEETIKDFTSQLPIEKRKQMKSSYRTQFQAYQELADKLSIISHFGHMLLNELDDDPSIVYDGKDRTANIKGQAANSLAQYKGPSTISQPVGVGLTNSKQPQPGSSDLRRADTRMFGETHPHILTNSADGTNLLNAELGGQTVTQGASQKLNDSKEPIIMMNVGESNVPKESGGPSTKASGLQNPPKLPDRPRIETERKSSQFHSHFPHDQKLPLDDTSKDYEESAHNNSSENQNPDSDLQTSAHAPANTTNTDLPPAYSPSQSKNP